VAKVESKFVSDVRKSAEDAFASGLYCSESVVLALAKAQGIESDLMPRAATAAYCSGVSRMCETTCGALTGAIIGISLTLGRSKHGEPLPPSYKATQRIICEFEQAFGARDCHALLGCHLDTPDGQATYCENRLSERCANYTGKAAEIAARILAENRG
jgi:C_GCAxxG_C_C family probable redox protein